MDIYLKAVLALIFVLGLIGIIAVIIKKLSIHNGFVSTKKDRRLNIIETLPIDQRNKFVLLRRDDAEHLVMIGYNSSYIIETNIKTKK
ncbi:hypothetical protein N9W34_06335 [Rickettsiales bacterium]|nr:hypothetical protein [Rickettsiales bacterium]